MLDSMVLVAPEMKWYNFEGLTDDGYAVVSDDDGGEHEISMDRIDYFSDACCGPTDLASLLDEEAILEITEDL